MVEVGLPGGVWTLKCPSDGRDAVPFFSMIRDIRAKLFWREALEQVLRLFEIVFGACASAAPTWQI